MAEELSKDQVIEMLHVLLDNQRPYPNDYEPGSERYFEVCGMNSQARRTRTLLVQHAQALGIAEAEITTARGESLPASPQAS